jgi:endoglucanase
VNSQNMPHPGRVFTLLYLFAIFFAFLSFSVSHAESIAKVRAQKLMRGINVGTVGTGISPECCENADEVKALQQKFDHVRLGVQLSALFDCKKPSKLNAVQLKRVLDYVKTFTDEKMPVIVTVRLKSAEGVLQFDLHKPGFVDQLAQFWRAFSSKLKKYHEDVFLEVLNEPYEDPKHPRPYEELTLIKAWIEDEQPKLVKEIRQGAPKNTIIATGARGSTVYGLLWLDLPRPNKDNNVIYSFHYYQPDSFARHGREPYPSLDSTQEIYKLPRINSGKDEDLQKQLDAQNSVAGGSNWNKERICSEIDAIADWADRNHAAVISDEFGVKKHDDDQKLQDHHLEHRVTWVTDVRAQLEAYGIGWTFWDYSDCQHGGCGHDDFGLIDKSGTLDNDVLQALGLGKR